jgi:hypothetical protein
MLWIAVAFLAMIWLAFYALTGLISVLAGIVLVLYMGNLFSENRPL